jgi:TetR/AcrR family transcriptional regulator of autoinduction and epiphytic fitness
VPTEPSSTIPHDGRRARRHRSRDLAVDALLDLLTEGVARPTAQQVAERSGVSLRSIFRIFDDVDTLHTEASARQLERSRHLFVEVPATGSTAQRIATVVDLHDRLYRSVAPVRRAAIRAAPESSALRHTLTRARLWLRTEIERVFAPELGHLDDDGATLAAVELALSFEAWDQCASGQELGGPARRAVATRVLTALLT